MKITFPKNGKSKLVSILGLVLALTLVLSACTGGTKPADTKARPDSTEAPAETNGKTEATPDKTESPQTEDNKPQTSDTASKEEPQGENVTITDMAGREITIPKDVKTIATPNADAFRMLIHLGAADKLIGIPSNMYNSKYSKHDTLEIVAYPEAKKIEKVGGGSPGTEINIEALIALHPDVIISWSYGRQGNSVAMSEEVQEKSGIPVICLNSITNAKDGIGQIEKAYTLMGKIAGKEKEAQEIIDFYKAEVKAVQERIKDVEPRTAYMTSPGSLLKKSSNYLSFTQLKFKNPADFAPGKVREVSKEQLLDWDPELIFMHTPSKHRQVNKEELKADPVLSELKAVKEDKVYHVKCFYMGWDISTGLVDLYYMGKIAYPDQFKDIKMEEKGNELLKRFYGVDGLYSFLEEYNGFIKLDD